MSNKLLSIDKTVFDVEKLVQIRFDCGKPSTGQEAQGQGDVISIRELKVLRNKQSKCSEGDNNNDDSITSFIYKFSGCGVYESAIVLARYRPRNPTLSLSIDFELISFLCWSLDGFT